MAKKKKKRKSNDELYGDEIKLIETVFGIKFEREVVFYPARRWRFDYALTCCGMALEIEGGVWTKRGHTSGSNFLSDIEKYNKATIMGWKLLRIASHKVEDDLYYLIQEYLRWYPCNHRTSSH